MFACQTYIPKNRKACVYAKRKETGLSMNSKTQYSMCHQQNILITTAFKNVDETKCLSFINQRLNP